MAVDMFPHTERDVRRTSYPLVPCRDGSTAFPQKTRWTYQRESRVWRGRGQSTVR